MFVLDLSRAVSHRVVSWLDLRSNASLSAPEETILYTLVRGRAELVLFGGIQKDVGSMTSRSPVTSSADTVSNSVFFLKPPREII